MGKKSRFNDTYAKREAEKYEHPIPSREFILAFLTERGKPATHKQLINELELEETHDQEALRRRLLAMVRDGQLLENRRGAYGLISKMDLIPGRVIGHREGFGFLVPEKGGNDLYLNPLQMRGVFPGDKILARVANIDSRGRQEAIVVDVLERNTQQLVGRLFIEAGIAIVKPVNSRINHDIFIAAQDLGSANDGQMVVIAITSQPTAKTRPLGKVVEVLGDHMAPGMEIDVAIRNHDLPHLWPENALLEAQQFPAHIDENKFADRADFRALPFVTIDGEDAKDFDDAVYCHAKPRGGWTLYVAIADVSHYVSKQSALDQEALKRGNSVYFPGHVIPMLPEVLSNGLCSLNPHVNRLTLVCEMSINANGKILNYDFHEAMIKSHARLTYTQVDAMLNKNDPGLQQAYQGLLPHLQELFALYKVLHKERQKRGAIEFNLPETKIIFGKERKIERIIPLERNDAHRLIEECMLCANICAARFLLKHDCPALYRIHEGPSSEKLMDLRKFLGELGLKLPGREKPVPKDYKNLLSSITERADIHLIQTLLLRSLSQAIYSPENKGHFGLAYDAYAHFTSPIRRYPDLLVHRAIRHVLRHEIKEDKSEATLEEQGAHCSMTERRADDATREATDWLKCEFMLDKVGEEFDGIISGVTNFGIFAELTHIYVEGLIHISLLPNDYYHFDPARHRMIGESSGATYRLGDEIRIKVVRVDLDNRQIDFILANHPLPDKESRSRTQKKKNSKNNKKKRRR